MSDSYIKLVLTKVPQVSSEEITYNLFELGAQGVSEKLKFIQTSQQYDPEIIPVDETALEAFFLFEDKEKIESLMALDEYKDLGAEFLLEQNKDWLHEWKKHYKPFCVTGDLWIYPSWEKENAKSDQEVILVDPGLAFGTGTHATTELCLKALSDILVKGHEYKSALDMGAGTGILSSLIFKRKVLDVVACEIDEMARDKCRENLEINGCSKVVVNGPEDLDDKVYDLVVANIIDGLLLKIKKDLVARTGKKLLLSGILLENEENVLKEFLAEGLELVQRTSKDEWACLEFTKNA
ncbi:MAG: 50S ribosomal protein L11 methyltransferase [Bdellovibrionales bacterium]